MTQKINFWLSTSRTWKHLFKRMYLHHYLLVHVVQFKYGTNLDVQVQMNGFCKRGIYVQWNTIHYKEG